MCRRHPLTKWGLLLGALLTPAAVTGQEPAGKIVVLNTARSVDRYRLTEEEFRRQMGGQTIIDVNLEESDLDAAGLNDLIAREHPDLVYSIGSQAFHLAGAAAGGAPQLFSSVINWQRFPQRAGVYGIANELSLSQELSLLRYLLPKAVRVGVLFDPKFNRERIAEAKAYSKDVGLTLVEKSIDNPVNDEVDDALLELLPQIDILWLVSDPGILTDRDRVEGIFQAADEAGKPVYAYSEVFIGFGASLVAAPDIPTIGRQAATLAQSLLRKEEPAAAVQFPAGSNIILDACHLAKLNTEYNPDALDSVNRLLGCH
ncbi:ABC transporter substrate-binding protein [Methylococcus capsulatus]|uniref:ABC transporter substrate-binding protein n=1 Tax=Methylococcus capsulatus TaxID=414 RepID=A0AA35XYH4_METCP|nr:ABC transporter substrate binding protein [Methylococcus capsulatus]CAI8813244.1 conserved exported protein of unknown function [Methylococcus capsulatus]